MLQDIVKKGSTDRSVYLRIIDSTDGTPETGVVFNTSGIDLWYRREGAAKVSITEATLAALTTAHSDGGFLHVGDGVYRLDLPDAAFATGANYVDFGGAVTGMIVMGGRVRLVDIDLEDTVRAGLTALPNAAAEAAGGLYTRGSGAGQVNQNANGQVDTRAVALAANVITTASINDGAITNAKIADGLLTAAKLASDTLTAAKFAADCITAAKLASDVATELQSGMATAANLATVAGYIDTEITDIQSRLPAALVSGRMDASVGAIAANAVTAAAIADGAIDLATLAADILLALGVMHTGTAAAIDADHITLASGHGITGKAMVVLRGGTNAKGKSRFITPASGDQFTVDPPWDEAGETTPSGTITYVVVPAPPGATIEPVPANLVAAAGTTVSDQAGENLSSFFENGGDPSTVVQDDAGSGSGATAAEIADAVLDEVLSGHTTSGTVGERLGRIPNAAAGGNGGLPTLDSNSRVSANVTAMANNVIAAAVIASDAITAAKIATDALTTAKFADGAITNAKIADGLLTAAKLATDAITAAKLASDVTTELQTGLATASSLSSVSSLLTTVAGYIDTEVAAIKAKTDNLPADTAAVIATVDTVVDAIKVVADRLNALVENSSGDRFTAKALEAGPVGEGGEPIPTVEDIRAELDANSTKLAAIKERTDNLPDNPADVSDVPTAATNAAAVQTSANTTPLPANVKKVNSVTVAGVGTEGSPWSPA